MGIDFYDRMWEEEQKEKERFGQRKNEIENELFEQRRKIEQLEKENAELKKDKEYLDKVNNEQTIVILKLNEQIESIKRENEDLKNYLTHSIVNNTKIYLQSVSNGG